MTTKFLRMALGTFAAASLVCSTAVYAQEVEEISYATITEVFDFGSSVSKIVVDTGKMQEAGTEVKPEDFTVSVERKYEGTSQLVQEMSWETFEYAESPTAKGERTVTGAYLSDKDGNPTEEATTYVTLEMSYGPSEGFGNPLGVNTENSIGLSVVLDCDYTIRYKDADGNEIVCDQKKDEDCKIIGVDDFTHGQSYTTKTQELLDDGLENDTLYYASYTPETEAETHPLIIWLHGMGEGGTDTRVPVLGAKATNLIGDEIQGYMDGAYVLIPQCPTVWMDTDGSGEIALTAEAHDSIYTQTLMELIQSYVEANPSIDTNRIYIGGCSNGGYMTIEMLLHYPDYFAAGYPVCEAYNDEFITDEEIDTLKNIPIWFTHAASDPLVVPDVYSVPTYERLIAAGAENAHFTYWTSVFDTTGLFKDEAGNPLEYFGHASWQYALDDQCTIDNDYVKGSTTDSKGTGQTLFQWLSQQTLAQE